MVFARHGGAVQVLDFGSEYDGAAVLLLLRDTTLMRGAPRH